jgi:acetyl esterase/lipase
LTPRSPGRSPDVTITGHELTTADGATIPLRWYASKDATGEPGPAAFYMHGGGMIAGHADTCVRALASL